MKPFHQRGILTTAREAAVTVVLITGLSISMMSAYSSSQLIIKLTALFISALTFLLAVKPDLHALLKNSGFRQLLLIFIFITAIFAATLFYSANTVFGLQKVIHFIITSGFVLVLYLYLSTLSPDRFKIALITTGVYAFLFIFTAVLAAPFVYNVIYEFEFTRCSHILSGRLIGTVIIVLLFLMIYDWDSFNKGTLVVYLIYLLYGLFFIGSRAAIITVNIILILTFLFFVSKPEIARGLKLAWLTLVAISALFIFFAPHPNEAASDRYENLIKIFAEPDYIDSPIQARVVAWNAAIDMIKEDPLFGKGIGGFRSQYESGITGWIKYPHNIFLNVTVEFGLIGLILFLYLLYKIFKAAIRTSPALFFYALFGLIFAQFTKDISTQTIFWISLIFLVNASTINMKYLIDRMDI